MRASVRCASRCRHSPAAFLTRNTSSLTSPNSAARSTDSWSSTWTTSRKRRPASSACERPVTRSTEALAYRHCPWRQDKDQIGRRGDEAPEVGGLTAGGADERPGQQDRHEHPARAEEELQRNRPGDVSVGLGRNRARCVERHVRRQCGEDPEPAHGAVGGDVLAGAGAQPGDRAAGEVRIARRDEISDQALLLHDLGANRGRGFAFHRDVVVVAGYGRSGAAVQERRGAPEHESSRLLRIGRYPGSCQHDLGDVSLGERPLARRDLDHRGSMLRAAGRPYGECGACAEGEREGEDDRADREPGARRERAKATLEVPHDASTTERMPPM